MLGLCFVLRYFVSINSRCLWGFVLDPCFVTWHCVSFLVLQPSRWGRESWLLYFYCLLDVMWLLFFLSLRQVCSMWLWHFPVILTYFWCFRSSITTVPPSWQANAPLGARASTPSHYSLQYTHLVCPNRTIIFQQGCRFNVSVACKMQSSIVIRYSFLSLILLHATLIICGTSKQNQHIQVTSCRWALKALMSMCIFAGSSRPSLHDDPIRTLISCTCSLRIAKSKSTRMAWSSYLNAY